MRGSSFQDKAIPPPSYIICGRSPVQYGGGTQPSLPLAVSPPALVPVALPSPDVNSQRQTVRPRARPRLRTGRRNIPRASPCRSVVSSTPPGWTTPDTPSLQPFTFDDGAFHSSGGGNAHPFRARGLPLPPWKRTRRKYRPHRTCRRHQPRAPNQSTGWA